MYGGDGAGVLALAVHKNHRAVGRFGESVVAEIDQGILIQYKDTVHIAPGEHRGAVQGVVAAAFHVAQHMRLMLLQVGGPAADQPASEHVGHVILPFIPDTQRLQRLCRGGRGGDAFDLLCGGSFGSYGGGTGAAARRSNCAACQQQGSQRQRKNSFHTNSFLQKSVRHFADFGVVGNAVQKIINGDQSQVHLVAFDGVWCAVVGNIGSRIRLVPAVHQQAVFQL